MNESDAVHEDVLREDAVAGDSVHEFLHGLLHDGVKDVHAPADLAGRVEVVAKRRRAARRGVTSAVAMVALGTTIGTFAADRSDSAGRPGPAYAVGTPGIARSLACAANVSTYMTVSAGGGGAQTELPVRSSTAAPMPGDPTSAQLCRYAGRGEARPVGTLAGAATVTDPVQLAQLQRAMNSGNTHGSPGEACAADNDEIAIVLIGYAEVPVVRTVRYERWCCLLIGDSTARFAGSGFDQLVTAWTGDWQTTAIAPSGASSAVPRP